MRDAIEATERPDRRLPGHITVLLAAVLLGLGVGAVGAFLKRPSPGVPAEAAVIAPPAAPSSPPSPTGRQRGRVTHLSTGESRPPPQFVRVFEKIPQPYSGSGSLIESYNGQERNPLWAPRMEAELRKRFEDNPPAAAGLEEMKISVSECRDNTCRVDFTYPESLLQRPAPVGFPDKRFTPLDIYLWRTGAFATYLKNLPPSRLPDGSVSETTVVAFKSPTIDPESYRTWAKARSDRARAQSSVQSSGHRQEVNR
jgi:hypothetical protein